MDSKKYIFSPQDYNIPVFKINNLKYYYTDYPELCCKQNLKPIKSDIKPFEFDKSLDILNKYYKNNYYQNLYNICKSQGNNLDNYSDKKIVDQIIYEYLKFRDNIYIITLWPLITDNIIKLLISELKKYGYIYYSKQIKLTRRAAGNLIYQLYSDTKRFYLLDKIQEKLDYIKFNKSGIINILVFENNSGLNISGSQSELKTIIRNFLLDKINSKNIRGDDLVHINDHYYQTLEYSKIYFNSNSLFFLKYQNLEGYLKFNSENSKSRLFFNTYKNWVINNISLIDQERFLIWGSVVLYAYGVREFRDIDGLISGLPENSDFVDLAYSGLCNPKTRLFFVDFYIINSKYWTNTRWDTKDSKLFKILKINNRADLIFNPDIYFYFNGIKIIGLTGQIAKLYIRRKFSDYGDILATAYNTGLKIKIPPILSGEYNNLKNNIINYLKDRYKYPMEIINKILKPMELK